MKKTKTQKGITLVALIITIIVLLILAIVAIRAVQGDGILGKAKEATNEYEQSKQNEKDKLDYYSSYIEGTVGQWKQNGKEVSKVNSDGSIIKLEVGSTVGSSGTEGVDYTVTGTLPTLYGGNTWAVLGAENGKLLLVTTKNITNSSGTVQMASFNGSNDLYKTITIDVNGTTTQTDVVDMDKVNPIFNTVISNCGITTTGTVAESVRSITVEDINRVTTYDPTNIGLNHNGGPYGGSTTATKNANEYGNIVKYKASTAIVASNGATGTTEGTCKRPRASSNSECTVKIDYYSYYPETLTTSSGTKPTTAKWYDLLFANTSSSNTYYWLAAPYVGAYSSFAYWGLRFVKGGQVCSADLWNSYFGSSAPSRGVRAVVALTTDIVVRSVE